MTKGARRFERILHALRAAGPFFIPFRKEPQMVRDQPENDRDDEIVEGGTEPTPPEGETPSPTFALTID